MKEFLNKVINADCLEIMKKLPDNCIDLVLTDPPYGIGYAKDVGRKSGNGWRNRESKEWDSEIPPKEFFDEMKRISKNQIIWGGNYFIEYLQNKMCWLVWDKGQRDFSLADCELAWTSFDSAARIFTYSRSRQTGNNERAHPTQKPVELMVWCLENLLLKNWKEDRKPIIFDGFAGSGTTAVAAKKCGCDFILVEKDKDYVEICNKRLAQETLF